MKLNISTDASPRYTAIELLLGGLWPVVIQAGKKAPIGLAWGSVRPTAESLNEAYWNNPGAGVGLLLGPRGLVIDVECDGAEGEESLRRLLDLQLILTCGWMSTRGKHRLFLYDPAFEMLGRSIIKSDDYPDLELRLGSGAKQIQSVVPPTMGRTWNGVWEIARLPGGVISKLKEDTHTDAYSTHTHAYSSNGSIKAILQDRAIQRATGYLAACPGAISGSGGHNQTFKVACHVGPGFDLDPNICLKLLIESYNPKCQPPWSVKELEHKVLDAYKVEDRRGWLYQQEKRP